MFSVISISIIGNFAIV